MLAGPIGGLAVVPWWLFLSRAPWSERLGPVVLTIVALSATSRIVHESIAKGGDGNVVPHVGYPILSPAFVAWAVPSRSLSDGPRRATMAATILLACGGSAPVRIGASPPPASITICIGGGLRLLKNG